MTNLEKTIIGMVKNIKHCESVDDAYHWSEITTVLEEAVKYISGEKENYSDHICFVGFTNGDQIKYGLTDKDGGSFYPDTGHDCLIPLYMLKTHWHRIESTSKTGFSFDHMESISRVQK